MNNSRDVSCLIAIVIVLGVILLALVLFTLLYNGNNRKNGKNVLVIEECGNNKNKTVKASKAPVVRAHKGPLHLDSAKEAMKMLSGEKPACVMLHSKSCGHCVAMEPDYVQIAGDMGDKIKFAMIEASNMKDFNETKLPQIRGFPTLIVNFGGKLDAHVGRRTKDDLKKMLSDALGGSGGNVMEHSASNSIVELESSDAMCELLKSNKKAIVMVYAEWCGHCKAMKADIEDFAKEVGKKGLVVARLNEKLMKGGVTCSGVPEIRAFPAILNNLNGKVSLDLGRKNKDQLIQQFTPGL